MSRRKDSKHSETKTPAAHNHPRHKIHAYWPPWLAGPLAVGLGDLGHWLWGRTLPAAAIVPLVLVLSTVGLSALTHRYASPRNNVQQWHAVLSVAVLGLSLSAVQMFGTGWPPNALGQSVLFLSAVLALSWNIRRFEVVRGGGQDEHGQSSAEEDWHGLKKPRSMKVVSTDDKQTTTKVKLAAGQTAEEVEKILRSMGSDLGTVTNGVRVVDGEREGDVEITAIWEQPLTEATGWEGPSHIGGSIADPISLGMNEQSADVILRMAGDYSTGIAPGHVAVVGMPRTGKGICLLVIWANLRARRDVYPVINDAAKGEQMLMFLRPGMPREKAWIDTTVTGAKTQATAVMNAIDKRNKALGEGGYSSWTPEAFSKGVMWKGQRIHMPALVFHVEEFAPIGIASPGLFTKIAEQGLSAGIFLITSLQRASHDRFPTSLRSVIGNGICYGAFSDVDVSFALPDDAVAGGASPAKWGQKFPGRAMASLNGQPDGMDRIPFKTHYASSQDEFETYMKEMMAYLQPLAPELDPCTAEAFGQPYQDYLAGELIGPDPKASPKRPGRNPVRPDEDDERSSIEEEEDDIPDDDDDPNEAHYVKRPHPEDCDPTGIDPRAPLPEWEGPEIDLAPPATPGKQRRDLSPQEKRELFREILQRLADEKVTEVRTGKLMDIWYEELGQPKARQEPTVARLINDAAAEDLEDGKPNDLLGTLDRGPRGLYYIKLTRRVAAMNGNHS